MTSKIQGGANYEQVEHMIYLRHMLANEFPDYVAYFVPDYAAEISANYDVDIQAAREQAKQSVKDDLSLGVDTPGQVLLCIVKDHDGSNSPVGYLWCKPDEIGPHVFISDFYILPSHRGMGYAKFALKSLETMFIKTGHREFRLRVAADNKIAQNLYTAAGFQMTGINMKKLFDQA